MTATYPTAARCSECGRLTAAWFETRSGRWCNKCRSIIGALATLRAWGYACPCRAAADARSSIPPGIRGADDPSDPEVPR